MRRITKAEDRYFADHGWLKTFWLFSFADYFDPQNVEFGSLRVFNDDLIAPHSGFPMHPHRSMEIVTIVFDGELTHEDSMGNHGTIKKGEVQRMSAGSGVVHSEFNNSDIETKLYQIWFHPNMNVEKSYVQGKFNAVENSINLIISGFNESSPIKMHADASISWLSLQGSHIVQKEIKPSRGIHLYVKEGEIAVGDDILKAGDQLRTDEVGIISFKAIRDSEALLTEVLMS